MGKEAAIPDVGKVPMILVAFHPSSQLEVKEATLRTKYVSELIWEYVTTTFINEYNAKNVKAISKRTSRNSRRIHRNQRTFASANKHRDASAIDDGSGSKSDVESTVKAIEMDFRSLKSR